MLFYSSNNLEKYNVSCFPKKILSSTTVFNIENNKKYLLSCKKKKKSDSSKLKKKIFHFF